MPSRSAHLVQLTALLPFAVGLWLSFAGLAAAQEGEEADTEEAGEQLEEVERALERDRERARKLEEQAESLRTEIQEVRGESVEVAASVQELESEITQLELLLAVHHVRALRLDVSLTRRKGQLADTLAALQRIAVFPPDAVLGAPGQPLDSLRSAMLLSDAIPQMERQAATIRRELEEQQALETEILSQRDKLTERRRQLEDEQQQLERLAERKRALEEEARAERARTEERLNTLADQADDLRDLIASLEAEAERERKRREAEARAAAEAAARAQRLREEAQRAEEERRADQERARQEAEAAEREADEARERQQAALPSQPPSNLRNFPDQPGGLVMPARGSVTAGFGDQHPHLEGEDSEGVILRTRKAAQVVAPFDGKVAYAGPFRRYGLILIIEHDERYHSLLAGFDRLSAEAGQWVMAGEPVGSMKESGDEDPELYIELRRAGQPIDPLPWLETSRNEAQG
ncbi:murein hydrolase activator EnvC family protein [Fodinicurvata fenggangensis]|uniref:murein hydrolase activator EnvC family protein n=1 Tax=Fodinicurvata fenggangensis TaxID=1121830 RepID=UPI00047ACB87|nr:peptidoglycan DD-metalloendopeptidase family protein [Fodinicurvata fenggangensis]